MTDTEDRLPSIHKVPTEEQIERARAMYVKHGAPSRQIAKKIGYSHSTWAERAKKGKWAAQRQAYLEGVQGKHVDEAKMRAETQRLADDVDPTFIAEAALGLAWETCLANQGAGPVKVADVLKACELVEKLCNGDRAVALLEAVKGSLLEAGVVEEQFAKASKILVEGA